MSTVLRHNRKASDRDIKRLVGLGLSLTSIARELNCHATSITLRLRSLKFPHVDTRHSFMEQVLTLMEPGEPDELADLLENNPDIGILNYVKQLIQNDLMARRTGGHVVSPTPLPTPTNPAEPKEEP